MTFAAGARNERNLALLRPGGNAHDLGYLGRGLSAAGNTLVRRCLAGSNCGGIAVTAGIAAAAAVSAGETFADGGLLRVDLNVEHFGGDGKQCAEDGAHHAENDNRKKNGIHDRPSFSQKICMPLKPMNASATRAADTRQIGKPSKHSG